MCGGGDKQVTISLHQLCCRWHTNTITWNLSQAWYRQTLERETFVGDPAPAARTCAFLGVLPQQSSQGKTSLWYHFGERKRERGRKRERKREREKCSLFSYFLWGSFSFFMVLWLSPISSEAWHGKWDPSSLPERAAKLQDNNSFSPTCVCVHVSLYESVWWLLPPSLATPPGLVTQHHARKTKGSC